MEYSSTKEQIRAWIEESIRRAKNPDKKEILKKKRDAKKKIIAKKYGL